MKSKIKVLITLIVFPVIIGFIYNSISPFGLNIIYKNHSEKSFISFHGIKGKKIDNNIFSLLSKDVWQLRNQTNLVFIDARDPWEYSKKRIANSINIPEFSFDSKDSKLLVLDKDAIYVIYCSSDDCDLSVQLARELKRSNFSNLLIMEDGIEGWKKNSFPMEGCE